MGLLNIINKIFKTKNNNELHTVSIEDQQLIDMANEILLGRTTSANNGGGGYDDVTMVKCTGVIINSDNNKRQVRYDTNDSWIWGVYYDEDQILRMYKEYKKTGVLPNLM